jgi:hypothetical protein
MFRQNEAKLRRSSPLGATVSGDDLPTGNPLLTSLGRLNRDFTEVRLKLDERGRVCHPRAARTIR